MGWDVRCGAWGAGRGVCRCGTWTLDAGWALEYGMGFVQCGAGDGGCGMREAGHAA